MSLLQFVKTALVLGVVSAGAYSCREWRTQIDTQRRIERDREMVRSADERAAMAKKDEVLDKMLYQVLPTDMPDFQAHVENFGRGPWVLVTSNDKFLIFAHRESLLRFTRQSIYGSEPNVFSDLFTDSDVDVAAARERLKALNIPGVSAP